MFCRHSNLLFRDSLHLKCLNVYRIYGMIIPCVLHCTQTCTLPGLISTWWWCSRCCPTACLSTRCCPSHDWMCFALSGEMRQLGRLSLPVPRMVVIMSSLTWSCAGDRPDVLWQTGRSEEGGQTCRQNGLCHWGRGPSGHPALTCLSSCLFSFDNQGF